MERTPGQQETVAERAGRIQSVVVEEAKRLDPVSRDRLAAALWRRVDECADEVAAVVSHALDFAMLDGHTDKAKAKAREDYNRLLDALPLAFERFQFHVLIAQAVSPPGQPGRPLREVDLHTP